MSLTSIKGSTQSRFQIIGQLSNQGLSKRNVLSRTPPPVQYTFGSGAGQINKWVTEEFNITASGNQAINLQDGTALDPEGGTQAFATVKEFKVHHLAGSAASSIKLDGVFITGNLGASTEFDLLLPGDEVIIRKALTVTVSTKDIFTITNNDGSNIADVLLELVGV